MKAACMFLAVCFMLASSEPMESTYEPSPSWEGLVDGEVHAIGLPVGNIIPVLSNGMFGLDIKTGEIMWDSAGEAWGFYCSDFEIDAGILFTGLGVYAVDAVRGEVLWTVIGLHESGYHALGYGNLYVAGSTFCIILDPYYLQWSSLAAFDEFTGDLLWTFDASSEINSDIEVGRGLVLFSSLEGTVYALDHKTGEVAWSIETGEGGRKQPKPVVVEDRVLLASNALYCVDVRTGQEIWTIENTAERWAQPVVCGDRVIGSSDGLYCIDLITGAIVWKKESKKESENPLVSNNRVYVSTGTGIECLNLDGEPLWIFELPGIDFGKAAADESTIVFPTVAGTVVALDVLTGEEEWRYEVSDEITCPPLLLGDFLVIGTYSGTVIGMGAPEYEKRTECEELLDSSKQLLFKQDYTGALRILNEIKCGCPGEEVSLEINALIDYAQDKQEREKWIGVFEVIILVIVLISGFFIVRRLRNRKNRGD